MNIEFCFGYPFSEKLRKKNKLSLARTLSGFYIYNIDRGFINVGSTEFNKYLPESTIEAKVTHIAQHETLHKAIYDVDRSLYDIGEKLPTKTEERFIEMMCKW